MYGDKEMYNRIPTSNSILFFKIELRNLRMPVVAKRKIATFPSSTNLKEKRGKNKERENH